MRQALVTIIEYNELEEIIYNVYGKKVELLCELEANNYSYQHFTTDQNEENDEYYYPQFLEWLEDENGKFPFLKTILSDLGKKEILPFGEFFVDVSW